jgi:Fur family ferric uptake transcriptional regulator
MEAIRNILKKASLRVTPVRVQVLDLITNSNKALSSQDIEAELHDVDRITLYRTLKTFEKKGIIHEAIDGTNKTKYAMCIDECSEHHHHDSHAHFHCESCGKTVCVEDVTIPKVQLPEHLKIRQANIILQGECDQCQ